MGKFYGEVGYAIQAETKPGVWDDTIIKKNYSGEVLRNSSKMREGRNLNDNLVIDNRLSIVADPFAYENFYAIRYVRWMGAAWKVISVEVARPRLILTIGGVYNEP